MKLLSTLVATSLVATTSALNLRAGLPEQEHPEAVRNLVKEELHSVEWELTVQGETGGDALDEEVVLCSDPDDPYSNIEMFDFLWIEAEEVASEFFDEFAERNGIKRSLLRWHLDSTPQGHDDGDASEEEEFDLRRRRTLMNFNYRIAGTCYWCDPDDADQGRRLGESGGRGGKLSDVLARTLKKKITKSCKGIDANRVVLKLVE